MDSIDEGEWDAVDLLLFEEGGLRVPAPSGEGEGQ